MADWAPFSAFCLVQLTQDKGGNGWNACQVSTTQKRNDGLMALASSDSYFIYADTILLEVRPWALPVAGFV